MPITVQRRYGEATTINFPLWTTTGVDLKADATFATGDVKIMKDEGTEANSTNLPTDEGQGYSLALTATEMSADRIVVYVVDSPTKVWLDDCIILDTRPIGILRRATAQAGAASSITLDASASSVTDFYRYTLCEIIGGTGAGQARQIYAYNGSTKVASVSTNWATNPDSTSVFQLWPADKTRDVDFVGTVNGNVNGSVGSVTGAVGSVTGNVGGNVSGNVVGTVSAVTGNLGGDVIGNIQGTVLGGVIGGVDLIASGGILSSSFAAGAITATAIATDAIGSAELAASAVSEIQAAVAAGSVASVVDRTGYKLASDGLDAVSTTAPAGVAANFREMLVQVWRRFFKRSTLTSTQLKCYADNGTTVSTTQAVSDDGTTQDQGAAS